MRSTLFDITVLIAILKDKTHFIHRIPLDEEALFLWFARILIKDRELVVETQGYSVFQGLVLERILGYDHLTLHSNTGVQRRVEFALGHGHSPPRCVLEVKGLDTDLFKVQRGRSRAESPIDQARSYARNQQALYCIATDYDRFVLCPFSAADHIFVEISISELFEETDSSQFDVNQLLAMKSETKQVEYLRQHFKIDRTLTRVFLALFHRDSLVEKNLVGSLRQEHFKHRHKLTKEFYSRFHQTRLQLIWEIRKQNPGFNLDRVVHVAQLILNRWLFICYAENRVGKDLLPPGTTSKTIAEPMLQKRVLKSQQDVLKANFSSLFEMLKHGEPIRGIYAYNGGLFEESIDGISIRDWIDPLELKALAKYSGQSELSNLLNPKGKRARKASFFERTPKIESVFREYLGHGLVIHPIWLNLLRIAGYDYQEEISVEMMGHVFEQSITDLEKILKSNATDTVGKRKKEGVYYTPDFITDFITRTAVCSYLLREIDYIPNQPILQTQDVINVFLERSSLETLEKLLMNIRILDPACGSGAFLNKAVDVLLEFHQRVNAIKTGALREAKPGKGKKRRKPDSDSSIQLDLTNWISNLTNQVLLNNIHGVDLNEESVLITRLSLFLKILTTEKRELPVLDRSILVGNSVVADKDLDPLATDWPSAFGSKEFHVVLGNPPYVKLQNLDKKMRKALKDEYSSIIERGNYDLYLPFIYRGWSLLSEKGILGYIVPNKLFVADYGRQLVEFFVQEGVVEHIVDFTWEQVFQEATTYTALVFLSGSRSSQQQQTYYQRVIDLDTWRDNAYDLQLNRAEQISLDDENLSLLFPDESEIVTLMHKNGKCLGKGKDALADLFVGLQTSADKVYVLDFETDTRAGPKLRSKYLSKNPNLASSSTLTLEAGSVKLVMMGEDIHRYEQPIPIRRLIFPYERKNSGTSKVSDMVPLDDSELRKRWPRTYQYLDTCRKRLAKRYEADKLPKSKWFKYVYDKNLDKFGQIKLFCQVLSSRCNFVFDDKGEIYFPGSGGGSGGYGVVLNDIEDQKPSNDDYLELLAILNSMAVDFYVKIFSSKFRHGFFSYSKMYLENIPVILNSLHRKSLVRCARNLIKLRTAFRENARAFDSWLSMEIPKLPKSYSISRHLSTSENDFRSLVHKCRSGTDSKHLNKIVSEFTKIKSHLIKVERNIMNYEREINECIFDSYGLNEPQADGETYAEVIRNHPFISLFGGHPK